jgi:hypothetical protein
MSITIGLASSGCSGGQSAPPTTITSEPAATTTPAPTPAPPTTTSEAPPAAPTPPTTSAPAELFPRWPEPAPGEPDTRPELERLEVTERTIRDELWIVPRIAHPDAAVRAALDREILATLDGLARVDANGGECWAPLAHPRLVTVVCYGYREGNRGGEDPVVETRHYAIEAELRRVDPDDAFVEGAPIAARLAAIVDPDGGGDHCCRGWLLGPYGVLLWSDMGRPEAELSYDGLHEFVRPDGPLAPMLASLATPPEPAAPSDPSTNAPPPPSTPTLHGWAFGPERTPAEALAAWRELSDEERAYVSIHVGREERTRLLVTSDRRWRDAYRLDEQPWRSGEWRAPSRLVRGANDRVAPARASTELVLREGPSPSSAVVSAIPRGTDLLVVIGSVGRRASSLEHGWAFVAADAARAGWVSARSLAASPRCHDAEVARPQFRGPRLEGTYEGPQGLAPVIGRTGLELLFTTTASERRSGFEVLTIDEACVRGPSLASGWVEGELEDLRVIGFGAEQGPLAVIVAAASTRPEAPEGTVRWSLFGPGASTAGWTADLPSDASLDESARVRVTVSAEQHLAIRWPDGREGHVRWDMAAIAFVEEPAGIGLPAPASTPTE